MRRTIAAAIVVVAVGIAVALGLARRDRDKGAHCGPGFEAHEGRCLAPRECPPPLAPSSHGCDAPDVRVLVPAASMTIGPSDWEAEGRVAPRTVRAEAFRVDAFEITRGAMGLRDDVARAASGVTRDEAEALCHARGGRLPTEDEWMIAAASGANPPRRYPWGDTGAVCRRAAWGLRNGPCDDGPGGPDTVGAHPDGDSPLHLHDLAGNVAEWVAGAAPEKGTKGPEAPAGIAKGGDWSTRLATDLRIWARIELPTGARDPRVGLRCVYPP